MKKIISFLTFFLIFAVLNAEEVANEQKNKETNIKTECTADENSIKTEEPKIFHYTPAIGMRLGFTTGISAVVDMNFDFFVSATKRKNNIYLGLNAGFRYTSSTHEEVFSEYKDQRYFFEVPLRVNLVFDFRQRNKFVAYLSFRFSAGAELMWWQETVEIKEEKSGVIYILDSYEKFFMSATGAYGIGLDVVFRKNVVMKFWIDSFKLIYPDFAVGLGYRF